MKPLTALPSRPLLDSPSDERKSPTEQSEPAERKTNNTKRQGLRSACVSKPQVLVCYSVPIEYAVIVARAIMLKWTCVGRIIGVPTAYGLLEQPIHFSVCTPSINENINACKIAITLICCHSDGKTKFLGSPHSFFGGELQH